MKIGTPSDQLAINRCVLSGLYEISIRLHRSVYFGRFAEIGRHRCQWRKIGNLPKQFARHAPSERRRFPRNSPLFLSRSLVRPSKIVSIAT